MSVNPEFIPDFWVIFGTVVYGLILYRALRVAAWWHLKDTRDFNIYLSAILAILFIWTMKAGIDASLSFHLIGATLLTLMFGWAFAVLGISVVVIGTTIIQDGSWTMLPLNVLLSGILPVAVSHLIFRFTDRRLPKNFFIYIFVCAFFGAALAMSSVVFATTLTHYLSGAFSIAYLQYNYYQYALLIMFPEAFVTGLLMTLFVAYRPHWVSTFRDELYLRNH
jgi:uncharacterized membrane protein